MPEYSHYFQGLCGTLLIHFFWKQIIIPVFHSSHPPPSDEGSKTPGPGAKVKTVKRFPGDSGKSLLLSGLLLPKSHIIFHALGDAEELNDYIG